VCVCVCACVRACVCVCITKLYILYIFSKVCMGKLFSVSAQIYYVL